MILFVVRFVKCRIIVCKYGVMFNGGGFCERCFEVERSVEEMVVSMNYLSLVVVKYCLNNVNGCEFFGLSEYYNLCFRCYRIFCFNMENILGVLFFIGLLLRSFIVSILLD